MQESIDVCISIHPAPTRPCWRRGSAFNLSCSLLVNFKVVSSILEHDAKVDRAALLTYIDMGRRWRRDCAPGPSL